jgi:glutaredoxin
MAPMEDIVTLEIYTTADCPYSSELREHLVWNDIPFVEYDVGADPDARARLVALTRGRPAVPLLVEDGRVKEVGWRGRSCFV